MKKTKTKILLYFLALFLIFRAIHAGEISDDEKLKIKNIFSGMKNRDGKNYDISVFKGNYVEVEQAGKKEIIVSTSTNECHANGWSEIWLISILPDGSMVPKIKLADNDSVDYRIIDLDNDGISELYFVQNGSGQGCEYSQLSICKIMNSAKKILFLTSGLDTTGAGLIGLVKINHELSFEDTNNDKILDIIDQCQFSYYNWTNGRFKEKSEYFMTKSVHYKMTYKFSKASGNLLEPGMKYMVQQGDTFSSMSKDIYGTRDYGEFLHGINNHLMSHEKELKMNQKILLPDSID